MLLLLRYHSILGSHLGSGPGKVGLNPRDIITKLDKFVPRCWHIGLWVRSEVLGCWHAWEHLEGKWSYILVGPRASFRKCWHGSQGSYSRCGRYVCCVSIDSISLRSHWRSNPTIVASYCMFTPIRWLLGYMWDEVVTHVIYYVSKNLNAPPMSYYHEETLALEVFFSF